MTTIPESTCVKTLKAKYKTLAMYKRASRVIDYQKFKEQRNATDKIVKTAQWKYGKSLIIVVNCTVTEWQSESKKRSITVRSS